MLPAINEMNRHFWCGGADGRLHILRCRDCGRYIHPYAARCPECRSTHVAPEPVSGRGTVVGLTVNHQPWIPGVAVPYVVAVVEIEEQSDIRLLTNMPRCTPQEARVGMPVRVYFEQQDDVFVPLFEPA
jgi:uncharacterized protein